MSLIAARDALTGGRKRGPAYWGLCFTAEEAGSTVGLYKNRSSLADMNLLMSTDCKTWTRYVDSATPTIIMLANVGDKVWFKAGEGGNKTIPFGGPFSYRYFKMTGRISASGSIQSLIDGDIEEKSIPQVSNFFARLFLNCTSLVSAPELPATNLFKNCYFSMFNGCTNLTTAPHLPAIELSSNGDYGNMFRNCSSLNNMSVSFTSWSYGTGNGFTNWVYGVAATGTFTCPAALGTDATILREASYCPEGWTVKNF